MTCWAIYMGRGHTVFRCAYVDKHPGPHSWAEPVELCHAVSPDGLGTCMLPTHMPHAHDWEDQQQAAERAVRQGIVWPNPVP